MSPQRNTKGISSPRRKKEWMLDMNKLFVPLQEGWKREVVCRSTHCQKKERWDIYYHPPSGSKLRSNVDVQKYLIRNYSPFAIENFSFIQKCLGFGEPYEIVRKAKAVPEHLVKSRNKSSIVSTGPKKGDEAKKLFKPHKRETKKKITKQIISLKYEESKPIEIHEVPLLLKFDNTEEESTISSNILQNQLPYKTFGQHENLDTEKIEIKKFLDFCDEDSKVLQNQWLHSEFGHSKNASPKRRKLNDIENTCDKDLKDPEWKLIHEILRKESDFENPSEFISESKTPAVAKESFEKLEVNNSPSKSDSVTNNHSNLCPEKTLGSSSPANLLHGSSIDYYDNSSLITKDKLTSSNEHINSEILPFLELDESPEDIESIPSIPVFQLSLDEEGDNESTQENSDIAENEYSIPACSNSIHNSVLSDRIEIPVPSLGEKNDATTVPNNNCVETIKLDDPPKASLPKIRVRSMEQLCGPSQVDSQSNLNSSLIHLQSDPSLPKNNMAFNANKVNVNTPLQHVMLNGNMFVCLPSIIVPSSMGSTTTSVHNSVPLNGLSSSEKICKSNFVPLSKQPGSLPISYLISNPNNVSVNPSPNNKFFCPPSEVLSNNLSSCKNLPNVAGSYSGALFLSYPPTKTSCLQSSGRVLSVSASPFQTAKISSQNRGLSINKNYKREKSRLNKNNFLSKKSTNGPYGETDFQLSVANSSKECETPILLPSSVIANSNDILPSFSPSVHSSFSPLISEAGHFKNSEKPAKNINVNSTNECSTSANRLNAIQLPSKHSEKIATDVERITQNNTYGDDDIIVLAQKSSKAATSIDKSSILNSDPLKQNLAINKVKSTVLTNSRPNLTSNLKSSILNKSVVSGISPVASTKIANNGLGKIASSYSLNYTDQLNSGFLCSVQDLNSHTYNIDPSQVKSKIPSVSNSHAYNVKPIQANSNPSISHSKKKKSVLLLKLNTSVLGGLKLHTAKLLYVLVETNDSDYGKLLAVRITKNGKFIYIPATGIVTFLGSEDHKTVNNVLITDFNLKDPSKKNLLFEDDSGIMDAPAVLEVNVWSGAADFLNNHYCSLNVH